MLADAFRVPRHGFEPSARAHQHWQVVRLAALRILDPAAGRSLQASLSGKDQLLVVDHDVVHVKTVRELAALARERDLGTELRKERDETDRHFAQAR